MADTSTAGSDSSDAMDASSQSSQPQPETEAEANSKEVLLADLIGNSDTDPFFQQLRHRDSGVDAVVRRLRHPTVFGAGVTGGDVDDDWYQAEVVGEEAVGGQNPTPDQNVTEDLLTSMGIDSVDGQPVRTMENLWDRDRDRWELDPESSEDYPEHNR
jgi:hypothetical protein